LRGERRDNKHVEKVQKREEKRKRKNEPTKRVNPRQEKKPQKRRRGHKSFLPGKKKGSNIGKGNPKKTPERLKQRVG